VDVDAQDPTMMERIADRVCRARALAFLAGAALVWIALNSAGGGLDLDPFPYRWLQRVSILVNGTLVFVALRARDERRARFVRLEQIRRARTEKARWEALYALGAATRGSRDGEQRGRPH
jgi:uncharacterized membrane protein